MKKLITTVAIVFCVLNTNAQSQNYIKRDTIEIVQYDRLDNPHHCYVIKRTEMGDPEYWKRKHRRERRWNRIGLGIFSVATIIGFVMVGAR